MKQFSEACTGWKGAFICKKNSMETKHPLSTLVFGLSKQSEKPSGHAQEKKAAQQLTSTAVSLMSFPFKGSGTASHLRRSHRQMIIPWNYAPGRDWWIVS